MKMSVWTPAQLRTQEQLAAVEAFFQPMSHADVLRYCCNLNRRSYPDAPALAASTVVVCLDTEGWDASSEKLKEVGINTFDSRDMAALQSPGPWGENILKNVYFYFARIQKNAHLQNKNYSAGNPEANRFGTTRFLNDREIKECLTMIFEWPLDQNVDDGCVCPVVLLGHALDNDVEKIQKLLHFNPRAKGNLVKQIDTQIIARDIGHWNHRVNQIGLQRLVTNMGFKYRDPHTASNDAAMTIIAALQLILDDSLKGRMQPKSLQKIVDDIELGSQGHLWSYGSDKFCFRCGSRNHKVETGGPNGGQCRAKVFCKYCFKDRYEEGAYHGHRSEACVMKAYETSNSSKPSRDRTRSIVSTTTESGTTGAQGMISLLGNDDLQLLHGGSPTNTTFQPSSMTTCQHQWGTATDHVFRPAAPASARETNQDIRNRNLYNLLNDVAEYNE